MKTKSVIYLLVIGFVVIYSCSSMKLQKGSLKEAYNNLYLFQNNIETEIKKENTQVDIDKNKFSLRFYNKRYNPDKDEFYSAQIAAFIDKSELDKINVGMELSDIPYFKLGTGFAANSSNKYDALILKNLGHHYLYYQNPERKRLNLVSESSKILKLEFEISNLLYDGNEEPISETNLKEFYLVVLIDRNLNGTIDDGELKKLTVKIN